MGTEDQKEEREVLESIFPDEITGTQCYICYSPIRGISQPTRYFRHVVPDIHNA